MKLWLKKNWIYLVIVLLVTCLFFYYGHCKAGFFIDEVYTYGLSNSHNAPYLRDVAGGDLEDVLLTREDLQNYAVVDRGEVLDFASVYHNQEADVHPPLYYWLFHLVSSFAGTGFSKWTGLIPEYFIFLATLFVLGKICNELFHKRFTTCAALLMYGLSYAGISTAIYIRMYGLLTLITCILILNVIRLLESGEYRFCTRIGFTIFAGMMTQYYFVYYAFFLCLLVCIELMIRRNWQLLWRFALCGVLGVALMVTVFPGSLKHIFVGNGQVVSGGVAVANLFNFSAWPERLLGFFHFVTQGIKSAVIISAIALTFLLITRRLSWNRNVLIVLIPAFAAWFLIAVMSAVQEERYIYNIFPAFIIGAAWLLSHLHIGYAVLAVIAALTLNFTGCKVEYIQPWNLETEALLDQYEEDPAVYFTRNKFAAMTADYTQLLRFEDVFATSDANSADMLAYVGDAEELVVFIDVNGEWSSGISPEEVLPVLEEETGLTDAELILNNTLSNVYVLR